MNYEYEYIKLKGQHERMKHFHDAKMQKLRNEIAELRAMINNPIELPKFDLELEEVAKLVASVTNVLLVDIISHKRNREIVTARSLFSYLCRMHLGKPFARIGVFLNRDHSTIINHCNNYSDFLKMEYKEETKFYNECVNRINSQEGQRVPSHNPGNGEGSNLLCEEIHQGRMASL